MSRDFCVVSYTILPEIPYTSFRTVALLPQNAGGYFHTPKRTCMCKSFCVCLIMLGLKLLQRGRPLKELRGRHVESIQFFAL